ncbi:hypothetical protein [Rhizobium sp. BK176]|uniref:hypothetical protein n=1 Tax=Rhizobium sp. BK176 TaxID=2587071 RepID=UPI00216A65F8|nr:hypothetical protein [Rhizobium sp. BK176]MCS4090057.1 hypothetical protein [Rhizobium sp. BK176]
MFADPNVKRQDGSDILNVAWFGSFDDDAVELDATDPARNARLRDQLVHSLAALRPALSDPKIGDVVAGMLNLYDHRSIMAVGEQVVLVNWGALPVAATASEAAFAKHTDGTIGRFLQGDQSPRIPGKPWTARGLIEAPRREFESPLRTQTPAQGAGVATKTAETIQVRRPARLWPPALLAALFALILVYLLVPGNLIYEKEEAPDPTALAALETSNGELTKKLTMFTTELDKEACAIDRTLVGLPPLADGATPAAAGGANP